MKTVNSYESLLGSLVPILGIHSEIRIVSDDWFYFDDSEPERFVISCPPYQARFAPHFAHYLASAFLIERGWPRPRPRISLTRPELLQAMLQKTRDERDRIMLYWASRPLDSLLDLYAFGLVSAVSGRNFASEFASGLPIHDRDALIGMLDKVFERRKLIFDVYVFCIDWFAMMPVLLRSFDSEQSERISAAWETIARSHSSLRHKDLDLTTRIDSLRANFKRLKTVWTSGEELIKSGRVADELQNQATLAWFQTGFVVELQPRPKKTMATKNWPPQNHALADGFVK